MNHSFRWAAFLLAACLGCSGSSPPDKVAPDGAAIQSRLIGVHWLYAAFQAKKGLPPQSLAELNEFGKNLSIPDGGPVHLSDEYLISPRDQQPIEIRFGLNGAAKGATPGGPILAHEKVGRDGKRFVVFLNSGRTEAVADSRFQELTR